MQYSCLASLATDLEAVMFARDISALLAQGEFRLRK